MAVLLMGAMAVCASCQQEIFPEQEDVPEGYVRIAFTADAPVMSEVSTRSVDIDGGGVQDMTLFCFDTYGLFITTAKATITPDKDEPYEKGTFSAIVPDNTVTVHLVANQNMTAFSEDDFRNKSASEVMGVMEGSSGKMIYWGRHKAQSSSTLKSEMAAYTKDNPIMLIRNHAKISVESNENFNVTGFEVYNTMAYGTVAPYDEVNNRFPTMEQWKAGKFVTIPADESKLSDIYDVKGATMIDGVPTFAKLVFECENKLEDPVSVIIRGRNATAWDDSGKATAWGDELYYRVVVQNHETAEMLPIRRNHHYKLNIVGELMYGKDNFPDALDAPATNNIWISISDNIDEVANNDYILKVEETAYVLDASKSEHSVLFNVSRQTGTAAFTDAELKKLEVTWYGENNVAQDFRDVSFVKRSDNSTVSVKSSIDGKTYNGTIGLRLLGNGNEDKIEGTLLIKFGNLQRKVKIVKIKQQEFKPVWVSTQVYAGTTNDVVNLDTRAHATLMFTIPETTPEDLFPMRVLISVNDLDVRAASGTSLPIIKKNDEGWYGSETVTDYEGNVIGYKYEYIAHKAGVQRVYFENKLAQVDQSHDKITIEAEHFVTVEKIMSFSTETYSIDIVNDYDYTVRADAAKDELIHYILVPRKKNAIVDLSMILHKGRTGSTSDQRQNVAPNPLKDGKDEFIIYTQNLIPDDTQPKQTNAEQSDCTFGGQFTESHSGGNAYWFQVNNYDATDLDFDFRMRTTKAVSDEPVRFTSNQPESPSGIKNDGSYYLGQTYRSYVFEMSTYRPFSFAAKVKDVLATQVADNPRTTNVVMLPFAGPGYSVPIEIDVKEFLSIAVEGGTAPGNVPVDPFGEEFEIYIDAPMLMIDESKLPAGWDTWESEDGTLGKLRKGNDGRFVYTVSKTKELENAFGTQGRKTLPFKTNTVVTSGEIVISSDKEMVDYDTEMFTVQNSAHRGSITYGGAAIPKDEFVIFERTSDNTRIGSLTMVANGTFDLMLRKEYQFTWETTQIRIKYAAKDGKTYSKTYTNLAGFFAETGTIDLVAPTTPETPPAN